MSNLENESLLRLPQVLKIIPISKSAWWQGCKDGRYPKPIKLGPRNPYGKRRIFRPSCGSFPKAPLRTKATE